ncbi:chromosomal replication initiator protein DnaA [Candidatus Saccharibacteria bacterium]|nr:chromosomal replication initiator protein DnaA [Candidatus Saccharibacteria bacterium]
MLDVEHKFLQTLEQRMTNEKFTAYGSKLKLKAFSGGTATIEAPTIFIRNQVNGRDHDTVLSALSVHLPNLETIECVIAQEVSAPSGTRRKKDDRMVDWTTTVSSRSTTTSRDHMTGLNPRYQLQNFVEGSNNDGAYNACLAVVDQPGGRYNPLYLYGGVGVGKTHLIQAVGNEISRKDPKTRVKYITIETFYRDYIDAIRKKVADFSQKYRNVDVLIVDDIQFIEGKEKSQEQFFHTFNDLQQEGKQIIISSDRHPNTISGLTDRLLSRFTQGLIIDIQSPDLETRCAIIEAKTAAMGFELDPTVVEKIADHVRSNIRELEGVLNKLQLESTRGRPITISTIEQLVTTTAPSRTVSPKVITKKVADFYHLSVEEITSEVRSKHILEPRQIAMYLLRTELHLSYPKIATEFKKKDHTPVLNAMRKIELLLSTDMTLRSQINQIKESLYA